MSSSLYSSFLQQIIKVGSAVPGHDRGYCSAKAESVLLTLAQRVATSSDLPPCVDRHGDLPIICNPATGTSFGFALGHAEADNGV